MAKLACSLHVFLQDSWVRAERVLVNPSNRFIEIWTVTHRDSLDEEFPVFFEAKGNIYSYVCQLEQMSRERESYRYRCRIIGTWMH